MGKASRNKGAGYEREVAEAFCGKRILRTGTHCPDIETELLPGFAVECKRRAALSVYAFIDQAAAHGKPLVVMRGDRRESLVCLRLEDFLELLDTMVTTTP